ncbi:hypothetical protein BD410DRAFT_544472 [Rickenella mellea]|uniref:BTB domain-containing protein n=1 Tax=Rickenella mellea TaxID=50990 RepID=A0A4Y7PRH1_9AGAM|nr:hypothetical protein BD410DRAFT_544472 [Rickenella mellea]
MSESESSASRNHETLYLPAGDLVLSSTMSNGGRVLFRVHRFMLAHHSPVFADMFLLPSTEGSNETYDGVSLIYMPDATEDIEALLQIFYDPSYLPYKRNDIDLPHSTYRALKLAVKYEVETVRKRIVEQVKAMWPATLDEWDAIQDLYTSKLQSGDVPASGLLPEPVILILISKYAEVSHALPTAFYHLSRMKTSLHWIDDTGNTVPPFRFARWNDLNREDLWRVLKGREMLSQYMRKSFCQWVTESKFRHPECTTRKLCKEALDTMWRDMGSEFLDTHDALNALRLIARPSSSNKHKFCSKCLEHNTNLLTRIRKAIWKSMAEIFEL